MGQMGLFLWLLLIQGAPVTPAPSYNGLIRLPIDLYTVEGTHLAKGQYKIEVKLENGRCNLAFSQDEATPVSLKGEALGDDLGFPPVAMPLVGTQYLRSSADPIGTEAERHSSKTGRAQYEEEDRPWKATMRVYTTPDDKEALVLFQVKIHPDQWERFIFKLLLVSNQTH